MRAGSRDISLSIHLEIYIDLEIYRIAIYNAIPRIPLLSLFSSSLTSSSSSSPSAPPSCLFRSKWQLRRPFRSFRPSLSPSVTCHVSSITPSLPHSLTPPSHTHYTVLFRPYTWRIAGSMANISRSGPRASIRPCWHPLIVLTFRTLTRDGCEAAVKMKKRWFEFQKSTSWRKGSPALSGARLAIVSLTLHLQVRFHLRSLIHHLQTCHRSVPPKNLGDDLCFLVEPSNFWHRLQQSSIEPIFQRSQFQPYFASWFWIAQKLSRI